MSEGRKTGEQSAEDILHSAEDILQSIKNRIMREEPASDGRSSDFANPAPFDARPARNIEGQVVVSDQRIPLPIDPQEDTAPLVADDARMSIGESFAALTQAAQLDDVASKRPAQEKNMDALTVDEAIRPLSQIEKDLVAAEAQFSDAEARRRQAEADARAALDGINKYQDEIDAAVGRLRQISPAGSNWSRQADRSSNVLTLRDEIPRKSDDPAIRLNYLTKS